MCLVYFISLLLCSIVESLEISVSRLGPNDGFFTPEDGVFISEESVSFFIKCVSSNHFSSNSSIVWNVNTKVVQTV